MGVEVTFFCIRKKVIHSIKGDGKKKNVFSFKPLLLGCVKETETRMKNWLSKKDYKG